jgi:hypothetical protein
MKNFLLLCTVTLLISGCATGGASADRKPSSQPSPEDVAKATRDQFYLQMLPANLRTSQTLSLSEVQGLAVSCQKTDYGPLSVPPKDTKATIERYRALAAKLNRPFSFALISEGSSFKVYGRLQDLQELACISDAITKSRSPVSNFASDFTKLVLSQANIDHTALELLLGNWLDGASDTESAKAILSSKLLNIYNVQDMVRSFSRKNLTQADQLGILKVLTRSPTYLSNSLSLSEEIFGNLGRAPSVNKFEIAQLMASSQGEVNKERLLAFALRDPLPDQDYTQLFLAISAHTSLDLKVKLFIHLLYSDVKVSASEGIYKTLSSQPLSPAARHTLVAFVLDAYQSSKRLGSETIFAVLTSHFAQPVSPSDSASLLALIRVGNHFSFKYGVPLFKLTCAQQDLTAPTAKAMIDDAMVLLQTSPVDEPAITSCVQTVGHRFLDSPEVASYYQGYSYRVADKNLEMVMLKDLLTLKTWNSKTLLSMIADSFRVETNDSYDVQKQILAQPNITADLLEQMSRHMVRHISRLTAADNEILALIEANPLTSAATKTEIQNLKTGLLTGKPAAF